MSRKETQRTLLALRHGHAVEGRDDHERPLTRAGRFEARRMGQRVDRLGVPDLVLCSSARRAQETLEAASIAWERAPRVRVERALYLASSERLLDEILGLSDEEASVLIVGHNPGIGALVHALSRGGNEAARARLRQGFPAGALALLRLGGARWCDAHGGGSLETFATPGD